MRAKRVRASTCSFNVEFGVYESRAYLRAADYLAGSADAPDWVGQSPKTSAWAAPFAVSPQWAHTTTSARWRLT
jgi:hypothetical protein